MRYLLLCALLAACSGRAAAVHELRPVQALTLRTDGETISGAGVDLIGTPWTLFSRGLLRFDVAELPAAAYGGVVRAELSFRVEAVENPAALELEIAPLTVAWSESSTWDAPQWPENPERARHVDHAADRLRAHTVSDLKAGTTVCVDVSREVDAMLYQQKPNHGWLLRMGPTVFGLPDAPTWRVRLTDFQLRITLDGAVPQAGDGPAGALHRYPSAALPPIRSPYYFHLFCGERSFYRGELINSWDATVARPEQGDLPLTWFFGPNNPYLDSEAGFVADYVRAAQSEIGIHVDEWQGQTRAGAEVGADEDPNRTLNDRKIAWSIAGIRAAKAARADFFVAVYWRGEDSIEPLVRDGMPDLLILEGQSHLNRIFQPEWGIELPAVWQRLDYARRLGVLERTIPLYGFFENVENYHPDKVLTRADLDEIVRETRARYPEMPGMAFYGSPEVSQPGSHAAELLRYAEELCYRYYIEPAPRPRLTAPRFEAVVATPHLELTAQAEGRDGRTIQHYDWFIDQYRMARTTQPYWIWDTRGFPAGRHIVTVQAVDSAWHRGAAQLPLTLTRPD